MTCDFSRGPKMYQQKLIVQNASLGLNSKIYDSLCEITEIFNYSSIFIAVAYATYGGCIELEKALCSVSRDLENVEKKWLISIDFGFTEPKALKYLNRLKNSEVRIPNGVYLIKHKLKPAHCFHPKSYLFKNSGDVVNQGLASLTGSANLTISGLHDNSEQAISNVWLPPIKKEQKKDIRQFAKSFNWLDKIWNSSTKCTSKFIPQYEKVRPLEAITEDDRDFIKNLNPDIDQDVSKEDFFSWSYAKYFWVQSYQLNKNRGANIPGNQIDVKRGTRVFFGFSPAKVPRNHNFGKVWFKLGNNAPVESSIRFGNNEMDKINLPPNDGLETISYDNTYILFERKGSIFELHLSNGRQYEKWKKESKKLGLYYQLRSGREFGYFNKI